MHNLSLLCKSVQHQLALTEAGTDDGTALLASAVINAVPASVPVARRPSMF